MTKQEYLDTLQKNTDKVLAANSPKVKRRRRFIAAILAIGSIIGIGIGIVGTTGEKEDAYSAFIEKFNGGDYTSVPFEFLNYKDTFDFWNNHAVGNDVNVLIDGGEIYSRDGIEVYPDEPGQTTKVQNGESAPYLINDKISYINVSNGSVFYRSDTDRCIHRFDLSLQQTETVFQGNVGETFITNDMIYCIDYSQGSALISMDLQGNNQAVVVTGPVSSFLVCGENLLYLDTTQHLYSTTIGSDSVSLVVSNIERFFVGGLIYAESKNTLFCFTPTGGRAEEVYTSENDTLRMVGVIDGVMFFQENGELYSYVDGTAKIISALQHDLYSSLVKCEDGSLKAVAYDQSDTGIKQTVVEFTIVAAEEGQ